MKYLMVFSFVVVLGMEGAWGNSLRKKSISTNSKHAEYGRNFEMRVENFLKLPLVKARYSTWYGYVSTPPRSIRPCEMGFLAGHKAWGYTTGTSGMVDWKIKEKDLTIILFWDVPFDGNLYCNSLGLAIYKGLNSSEPSYENSQMYFDDIYHNHANFPSTAVNEKKTINTFYDCNQASEFCTSNAGISVCGIMSISSDAKFEVQVSENDVSLNCAGKKATNANEDEYVNDDNAF